MERYVGTSESRKSARSKYRRWSSHRFSASIAVPIGLVMAAGLGRPAARQARRDQSSARDGRGVIFDDPNGYLMEIITPYGDRPGQI